MKVKEPETGKPVVRISQINVDSRFMSSYLNDPAFENFNPLRKSANGELIHQELRIPDLEAYERDLLQDGVKQGLTLANLEKALYAAKKVVPEPKVPVIIEKLKYENKDSYVFVFKWDGSHIYVVVIEESTNKVLYSEHCA